MIAKILLIALKWFIAAYSVSLFVIMAFALFRADPFMLFIDWAILAPTGLIFFVVYGSLKRAFIRKQNKKLSLLFCDAASDLRKSPPKPQSFDVTLSNETTFIWEGPIIDPLPVAVTRLLISAKNIVMAEEFRRDTAHAPKIAEIVEQASTGLLNENYTETFESIGHLFADTLARKHLENPPGRIDSSEDFVLACQSISELLWKRRVLDAEHRTQLLIQSLAGRPQLKSRDFNWQALIAYWLIIRINILSFGPQRQRNRFWLGPSKMLAKQLEYVTRAYKQEDWARAVEVIYTSFDWRYHVPRILVSPIGT